MKTIPIDLSKAKEYQSVTFLAGVQGENRASALLFYLPSYLESNLTYRLVFEPGGVSESLFSQGTELFYEIPNTVTQHEKVNVTLEGYDEHSRVYKSEILKLIFSKSAKAIDPLPQEQNGFRQDITNLSQKLDSAIYDLSNSASNPVLKRIIKNTQKSIILEDVSPKNHIIKAKLYHKNLIDFPYKDGKSKLTNGIRFTVNADGTITARGTGIQIKDYATFYLTDRIVLLDGQKYSLSKRTVVSFEHNGNIKYFGSWNSPFTWHSAFKNPVVYAEIPKGEGIVTEKISPQLELGEASTAYEQGFTSNNIYISVYDNIGAKKEYPVDSHGIAEIKSISPRMEIICSDKNSNIYFEYQCDINTFTLKGDYEKLLNLPKINGRTIKGDVLITKTTLGIKDGERGPKGEQGETGAQGLKGETGDRGADGISPTISLEPIEGGNRATITDVNGTSTFDILNGTKGDRGADGVNGKDGVSPTINSQPIEGGTKVTISDSSGEKSFDILNGKDGSGGGNNWRYLGRVTTPQDTVGVYMTHDKKGKPLNLKEVLFQGLLFGAESPGGQINFVINKNIYPSFYFASGFDTSTVPNGLAFRCRFKIIDTDGIFIEQTRGNRGVPSQTQYLKVGDIGITDNIQQDVPKLESITSVGVASKYGGNRVGAKTFIDVWGLE